LATIRNSCLSQPVKHSRAQRTHDNNSKNDLDELSEIETQSNLDIKKTLTRNDINNTPSKSSALETVDDENEDLDTPALSLCPSDASERTRYEYKVRANTTAL